MCQSLLSSSYSGSVWLVSYCLIVCVVVFQLFHPFVVLLVVIGYHYFVVFQSFYTKFTHMCQSLLSLSYSGCVQLVSYCPIVCVVVFQLFHPFVVLLVVIGYHYLVVVQSFYTKVHPYVWLVLLFVVLCFHCLSGIFLPSIQSSLHVFNIICVISLYYPDCVWLASYLYYCFIVCCVVFQSFQPHESNHFP